MRLGSTTILVPCLLALAFLAPDQAAAEPTPDQVAAIKSNCRSDFMSKCSGVPRGGAEAMQCLKKNMANVSAPCQQALKAVTAAAPAKAPTAAPAAAKQESAPAPQPEATAKPVPPTAPETPSAGSKPDAATAATTPEIAPASKPTSPPEAAAKTPVEEAAPKEAKAKEPAAAEKPGAATATKPAVAAPVPSEETTTIIGFIPPRKKLMILNNCRKDLDTYCADVSYGDGRQLSCLVSNKASLSPDCQGALAKLTN
jgi:outer membrane biosynthesis protein TonB